MDKRDVIKEVKDLIEKEMYIDKHEGEEYGFEIYVDYRDGLNDSILAKISKADDPKEAYDEILNNIVFDAEEYYYEELFDKLEDNIPDYADYEDEIRDWVHDHVYYYLPDNSYDDEVDVVIALDTGDKNTDFTECNILNYYGMYGGYGNGKIPENSPIRWLAKQQKKLTELNKAIKDVIKYDEAANAEVKTINYDYSKFSQSVIQELQNASSHMNTLVFLVKMPLHDFLNLRDMMKSEEELNKSYEYNERLGTKSFTISKDVDCGLYDVWGGGGSVLEINLEKDVTIPIKAVWDAWIDCRGCRANDRGYDLYDVYGLTSSAYRGKITFNNEKAA